MTFIMGLLDDCQLHFDSNDLYSVLKISKEASDNEGSILFYFYMCLLRILVYI